MFTNNKVIGCSYAAKLNSEHIDIESDNLSCFFQNPNWKDSYSALFNIGHGDEIDEVKFHLLIEAFHNLKEHLKDNYKEHIYFSFKNFSTLHFMPTVNIGIADRIIFQKETTLTINIALEVLKSTDIKFVIEGVHDDYTNGYYANPEFRNVKEEHSKILPPVNYLFNNIKLSCFSLLSQLSMLKQYAPSNKINVIERNIEELIGFQLDDLFISQVQNPVNLNNKRVLDRESVGFVGAKHRKTDIETNFSSLPNEIWCKIAMYDEVNKFIVGVDRNLTSVALDSFVKINITDHNKRAAILSIVKEGNLYPNLKEVVAFNCHLGFNSDLLLLLISHVNIQNLNLSNNDIRSVVAAEMAAQFATQSNLISLDVSDNHIGIKQVINLSNALHSHSNLIHLNMRDIISYNEEDNDDIDFDFDNADTHLTAWIDCLSTHPSIVSLDISDNDITNNSIYPIAKSSLLSSLDVSFNSLQADGVSFIINNTKVRELHVESNDITYPDSLQISNAILNNKYLKGIDLTHAILRDGASLIASNSNLEWLVLKNCHLTDVEATSLSKHNKLSYLDLSWNEITDIGALELAKNKWLATLVILNNPINDLGARELVYKSNLKELHISGAGLTQELKNEILNLPPNFKRIVIK